MAVLKDIAGEAAFNDYFIFIFNCYGDLMNNDEVAYRTIFNPYDVLVKGGHLTNRDTNDTTEASKKCISLKILQEYFQSIPANNQLFISEAGPSEKFKSEFIKTLMQNSPEVARILNKNRIIIVPNGFGFENVKCHHSTIQKGPINYYISSLESANIFDLFNEKKAEKVAFAIKNKAYTCGSFNFNYFDIFFERKFLKTIGKFLGMKPAKHEGLGLKQKN